MKKKKAVNPPTEKEEALLDSIVENSKDTVEIRGRKWHVEWMRNGTKRKVTHIMLTEKEDDKVNSKCAAAIVLNGYWKILFFYWFLWRWFFYVMQYSDEELLPLIETGKKKVRVEGYCACTILLTEMKDTVKSMTREEVNRIRQESFMALRGRQEKNIELGLIDCPIIVYERGKKRKGGKGEGPEFEKADALDVVNKADEWQKKYGNAPKGKGVRISLEGLKMLKKDNGGK